MSELWDDNTYKCSRCGEGIGDTRNTTKLKLCYCTSNYNGAICEHWKNWCYRIIKVGHVWYRPKNRAEINSLVKGVIPKRLLPQPPKPKKGSE